MSFRRQPSAGKDDTVPPSPGRLTLRQLAQIGMERKRKREYITLETENLTKLVGLFSSSGRGNVSMHVDGRKTLTWTWNNANQIWNKPEYTDVVKARRNVYLEFQNANSQYDFVKNVLSMKTICSYLNILRPIQEASNPYYNENPVPAPVRRVAQVYFRLNALDYCISIYIEDHDNQEETWYRCSREDDSDIQTVKLSQAEFEGLEGQVFMHRIFVDTIEYNQGLI